MNYLPRPTTYKQTLGTFLSNMNYLPRPITYNPTIPTFLLHFYILTTNTKKNFVSAPLIRYTAIGRLLQEPYWIRKNFFSWFIPTKDKLILLYFYFLIFGIFTFFADFIAYLFIPHFYPSLFKIFHYRF